MPKRTKSFATGSKPYVKEVATEFDNLANIEISILEKSGYEVCGEVQAISFATQGNALFYAMGIITYETEPDADYDDKKK